jgi:hypothetical protein
MTHQGNPYPKIRVSPIDQGLDIVSQSATTCGVPRLTIESTSEMSKDLLARQSVKFGGQFLFPVLSCISELSGPGSGAEPWLPSPL